MWLYLPNRTSNYSQEPGGSLSLSDSQCQRLAQSAMWRSTFRRPESWRRAFEKDASMTLLSGVTCEPSTADAFVDEWLESLEDSPAPTCPSPASGLASTGSIPGCGGSTPESFAKFNPDGSLSKTSRQFSIFQQDEPYSENFPKWGLMQSGELFELPTWAPRISENGHSSWPTPIAQDTQNTDPEEFLERKGRAPNGAITSLNIVATNWPTPDANTSTYSNGHMGPNLRELAAMWRTPQSHDAAGGDPTRVNRFGTEHGGRNLADDVTLWRTPDSPGTGGPRNRQGSQGNGHQVTIAEQAEHWMTPNVPNGGRVLPEADVIAKGATADGKRQVGLEMQSRYFRQDQATQNPGDESSSNGRTLRRRLNPAFVCWLMTWPWWWTHPAPISFAPEAMALWLSKARQHLSNCVGGLD